MATSLHTDHPTVIEASRNRFPQAEPAKEKVVATVAPEVEAMETRSFTQKSASGLRRALHYSSTVLVKFVKFLGPGALIGVAYVDPDNFQTDISSGMLFKYKLLFMVLVSNIIAIFLQALSVKLGSVTGMDLAQMNRAHLPRWLNIALWIVAEAAIICTDVGQVIGTAIAINLLVPKIPVVAGCALSIVDTLFILFFYQPDRSMKTLRTFEIFVAALVLGVVICICIQLSYIKDASVGEVFRGYLPSAEIFKSEGLFECCAILGGAIMPHTLYLGSGIVQARLRDFDVKNGHYDDEHPSSPSNDSTISSYRPSLTAIRSCMSYSIADLVITLFFVAVFVNSAILIIAAAADFGAPEEADLFGMYNLFVTSISPTAGTLFACGLLFSGTSAGIVATMAGQMVCEGAINWRMSPFLRRLVTRSIAILPAIIIAAATGRKGLAAALNGANFVLSVALSFVIAPLIWYTSRHRYMTVRTSDMAAPVTGFQAQDRVGEGEGTSLANNWATTIVAALIWLIIGVMNVATWVFLGLGKVNLD